MVVRMKERVYYKMLILLYSYIEKYEVIFTMIVMHINKGKNYI